MTYSYSNAQRPVSAVDSASAFNYATSATYAPQGAPASILHGQVGGGFGGITESYGFNNRLELNTIQASSSAGTALSLAYSYALPGGNNGSVASQTNNRDTNRTQSYSYDTLNRILTAQTQATTGTNCWGQSFSDSALANLFSVSVTQCSAPILSVTVNNNNQISDVGFGYDAAGNMTADGSYTYTYDAENRITSAAGVSYTYDGNSLRVQKSNGTLYWRSITGDTTAESDLTGNITSEYVFFAGRRIARRDSAGNVYYYFADRLGSTRVITQSNGTICYEVDYYPYGGEISLTNTCPQNYKFTGYERDPETGLDYAFARYYNPRLGRFMSPDPLAGGISDPQSLNRYAYTLNNPMNFVDPLGLKTVPREFAAGARWYLGAGLLGGFGCTLDGLETRCSLVSGLLQAGAVAICLNAGCSQRLNLDAVFAGPSGFFLVTAKFGVARWDVPCPYGDCAPGTNQHLIEDTITIAFGIFIPGSETGRTEKPVNSLHGPQSAQGDDRLPPMAQALRLAGEGTSSTVNALFWGTLALPTAVVGGGEVLLSGTIQSATVAIETNVPGGIVGTTQFIQGYLYPNSFANQTTLPGAAGAALRILLQRLGIGP